MPSVLRSGMILETIAGPFKGELDRVINVMEDEGWVFLMHIAKQRPKATKLPRRENLSVVEASLGNTLLIVPECIRPPVMELPENEVLESAKQIKNHRKAVLGDLLSNEKQRALMDKRSRAALVLKQAQIAKVSENEIRRLLTNFWWYGCTEQALLGQTWEKGGAGKPRRAGEAKRGRPNAFAEDDSNSPDIGVNVNEWHLQKFRRAIDKYWVQEDLTLSNTYCKMVQTMYIQKTKGKDNVVRVFPISERKIPTEAQFRYWAKKIIADKRIYKQKLGDKDWEEVHRRSRGSSSDLAVSPGDIYDVDGTGGKIELTKTGNRADRVGRPTIVIAVDRASDAIVGAALSMHAESWNLYQQCLFSAFTSKTPMLNTLGLPCDFWSIHAVPVGIFVDRGPGNSKAAGDALIDRLGLERATAPPRTPRAKGLVEGLNTKIHNVLSLLQGGYTRKKSGSRAKDKRANARKNAVYTQSECFKELVKQIDIHNKTTDVSHLLTARMRADGVSPVPEEIFKWGIKNRRGGENRHLTEAQIYLLLLDRKPQAVYPEGIQHQKAFYWSEALDAWREQQMLEHCGEKGFRPRIEVMYDPVDPAVCYWESSPGTIDRLVIHEQGLARFEGATMEVVETTFAKDDRKVKIEKRRMRARGNTLQKRQKQVLIGVVNNLKAQSASDRPITVSRKEEQAREDADRARRNRELVNEKMNQESIGDTPSHVKRKTTIESGDDDMGSSGAESKARRQARYTDLFAKTFGGRVK